MNTQTNETIVSKNTALLEIVARIDILDRTYIAGKTNDSDDTYATWAISQHDGSSNIGHYGFASRFDATNEMAVRAGLDIVNTTEVGSMS